MLRFSNILFFIQRAEPEEKDDRRQALHSSVYISNLTFLDHGYFTE
jgi:hypothetical protein